MLLPCPELATGKKWEVTDGSPDVVPLSGHLSGEAGDASLAHAVFTPEVDLHALARQIGCEYFTLLGFERFRVRRLAAARGVECNGSGWLPSDPAREFIWQLNDGHQIPEVLAIFEKHAWSFQAVLELAKMFPDLSDRRLVEIRMADSMVHEHGAWGKMTIQSIPLPLRYPPQKLARRAASRDSGLRLGDVTRWASDRRVFRATRAGFGGTVLVDASSSMHWFKDDLLRVLSLSAGAVIALYGGNEDARTGVLRIVARGSRYTNDLKAGDGNNVIDGPALRWLARRPAPRFWVSDGGVTGVNDWRSTTLSCQADRICRLASITRVEDAEDLFRRIA